MVRSSGKLTATDEVDDDDDEVTLQIKVIHYVPESGRLADASRGCATRSGVEPNA